MDSQPDVSDSLLPALVCTPSFRPALHNYDCVYSLCLHNSSPAPLGRRIPGSQTSFTQFDQVAYNASFGSSAAGLHRIP